MLQNDIRVRRPRRERGRGPRVGRFVVDVFVEAGPRIDVQLAGLNMYYIGPVPEGVPRSRAYPDAPADLRHTDSNHVPSSTPCYVRNSYTLIRNVLFFVFTLYTLS